ncbi:MAG: helix-turn-helix domain-containing protein, partial [Oscillospiraceae bacterium]|nr:helix-turn-helix domain-containing protein [Oscillospiraceae bacterium]
MFSDNLITLRKLKKLSQEELAEKAGVSRQTLSKWETGESLPDIEKAKILADFLEVSLDDLLSYNKQKQGLPIPPKGKHAFGIVKVGEKGQIVIPAQARKVFNIQAGDNLFVLGDDGQGLALIKESDFLNLLNIMQN